MDRRNNPRKSAKATQPDGQKDTDVNAALRLLHLLPMTPVQRWLAQLWRQWVPQSSRAGPAAPADTLPAPVPRELDLLYAQQAEQVRALQRQAQLDVVTGLPSRRHFLGLLQQRMETAVGPGLALVLLRVQQLETLNQRLGFEATDRLLAALGQVLLTYVDRVPGTCAGRLNGSDFALCLPVAGVALETAASLHMALASAPALRNGGANVAVGGVDQVHPVSSVNLHVEVGAVLAAADAALARAEARGATGQEPVVVEMLQRPASSSLVAIAGERAWRAQIAAALEQGRVQLQALPVSDKLGHTVHLECRLRVQRQLDGDFETAEGWFALARRSRLLPQADLCSVEFPLPPIAAHRQPLSLFLSSSSLLSPLFIINVASRLAKAPAAAGLLIIECAESLSDAAAIPGLAAAAQVWRPWGVRIGMGPMADLAQHLPALKAAGIRHVSLDARALQGVAQDSALRGYLQGLVALVHGMGLSVLASAVNDAAQAQALWELGVDGVSGAAVRLAEVAEGAAGSTAG